MSTTTRIEDLRHEALVNIDNLRVLLSADQLNARAIQGAAGNGLDTLKSQLASLAGLLDDARDPTEDELAEVRSVLAELLGGSFEVLERHDVAVGVAALRVLTRTHANLSLRPEVLRWFARSKGAPIPAWARTMEALPEE